MLIGPPIGAEIAMDKCLVGLLTCASTVPNRLPRATASSGVVVRTSALTVAGQWRIFTAFLLPGHSEQQGIMYHKKLHE